MVETLETIYQEKDQEELSKFLNSSPTQDSFSFTLGGDIEGLILTRDGKGFIRAKDTKFNSTSPKAWVGKDGSGNQVEFRFKPSKNPYTVVSNFKNSLNIFKTWVLKGNSSGVVFGYYRFSQCLGGHIHFGKDYSSTLIKCLDYYLAVLVSLLSNSEELKLRCKSSYGKLSGIEEKSYGFEYRTLGSFPMDKNIANETYVLAGLIVDQYKNLPPNRINKKLEKCYYNGRKEYIRKKHLPYIQEGLLNVAIKRFKNWGWALLQILRFFNRLEHRECIISSKKEILTRWRLIPNIIIPKYKIVINSDDYLDELRSSLLKNINIYTNLDADLLLYGVKASRTSHDFQIWVNDSLYEKLKLKMTDNEIQALNIMKGKYGIAEGYKYSIGLSFKLRKLLHKEPNKKISQKWLKIIQEVIKKCAA